MMKKYLNSLNKDYDKIIEDLPSDKLEKVYIKHYAEFVKDLFINDDLEKALKKLGDFDKIYKNASFNQQKKFILKNIEILSSLILHLKEINNDLESKQVYVVLGMLISQLESDKIMLKYLDQYIESKNENSLLEAKNVLEENVQSQSEMLYSKESQKIIKLLKTFLENKDDLSELESITLQNLQIYNKA